MIKSVATRLFVAGSLVGGWVLLLFILSLCGAPVPHAQAFSRVSHWLGRHEAPLETAAASQVASAAATPAKAGDIVATQSVAASTAASSPTWYIPNPLRINLPKQFYAVAGVEISLYFEDLVLTKWPEGLRCEIDCQHSKTGQPLGSYQRRRWTITAADADVGEHQLKVAFKDVNRKGDQRPLAEGEITLCVVPRDAGQGRDVRLLMVGASITHVTHWVNETAHLLSQPGNPAWKMLGENTTPQALPGVRHEGYGGFIWKDFLTLYEPGAKNRPFRDTSPFVFLNDAKKPELDIPRYIRKTCDGRPPQYIFFELGSNDIFGLQENKPDDSAYWINVILNDAETLLKAWRAAAPQVSLGLIVPPQFTVYDLCYTHLYSADFNHWRNRTNNFLYIEMLTKKFAGREAEGIYLVPVDVSFDPIDGYPVDNACHPNELGASQYGTAIYSWLKWHLATHAPAASKPAP